MDKQAYEQKKRFKLWVPAVIGITVALITVLNPFYAQDSYITDYLYTRMTGISSDIIIVGVDEETLSAYGNFNKWSREKTAELMEYFASDKENLPLVLGVDIMFTDALDDSVDERLIEAARGLDYVVMAGNLVYRGAMEQDGKGNLVYNSQHISAVEMPFEGLNQVTIGAFSNACIASDGCVRYAMNDAIYNNSLTNEIEKYDSFAYSIYKIYAEKKGINLSVPSTNRAGQFQFFYSGESKEFSHVSLADVLDGKIPANAFKNKIVLLGAYAPGFQDAYQTAADRGSSMYGVEIHANIIQAYIQQKTANSPTNLALLIITTAVVGLFIFLTWRQKLSVALAETVAAFVITIFAGKLAASKGIVFPLIYLLLTFIIVAIYHIVEKYVFERLRRMKTLEVFKKYVAPQVVEEISKSGDFKLKLGGEKRDIAVLFVDIRGFTPLSESLEPEQVVSVLNEYLALATTSILNHSGTLDKFIGDAAMAIFNAPFDQNDYIYEAVAAALDLRRGADELKRKLEQEVGKTVAFGVGINCGEAVVGNIGCEFRMDYTAIGDTVNTAARLESNAKAGEILISEYVYEKIKDRILAEPIGEIPLKGKSKKLQVYRVKDINNQVYK